MVKEQWKINVDDINNSLKLEPAYELENEQDTLEDIVSRQGGEDAFVDEDYLPENEIGLKDSTVAWLIDNDVPVPETWVKRLKRQAGKAKEPVEPKSQKVEKEVEPKKEKPAKKAEGKKSTPQRAKNELGHLVGSGAAELDELFLKGVTEDELQKKGYALGRYKSHFRHLEADKADVVKVTWKDDKITAKLVKAGE